MPFKNIPDQIDDILNPKYRFSVYGSFNSGSTPFHQSFKTYQEALDYYTKVRDEGAEDLMMDDNRKGENLANNEL